MRGNQVPDGRQAQGPATSPCSNDDRPGRHHNVDACSLLGQQIQKLPCAPSEVQASVQA